MARARDLLDRFRPAGAPGAADATGVPADRDADPAAELEPVFAQLIATEQECAHIRDRAQADADRLRARAAERARAVVAAAGQRRDGVRAAVLAQARERAEHESAAVLAAGRDQAAQVRRRAAERLPRYVDSLVASVRALLEEPGTALSRPPDPTLDADGEPAGTPLPGRSASTSDAPSSTP